MTKPCFQCFLVAAIFACGEGAWLSAAESDWPGFRGPGGQGVSADAKPPVSWSVAKGVLWKEELPGAGASSPIVVDGKVFVTAYSGYGVPNQRGGSLGDLKRHVVALSLADGNVLWQKDIPASQPEQSCQGARIGMHGFATNTPAADAERLYVFFGKSGVFAFSHDGKQLWRQDVGSNVSDWGSAASPVLYKDFVIVNAFVESGAVVALNRQTGKEVWRFNGLKNSWCTPALVEAPGGKTELVLGAQWKLLGLDPDKGQELWSCGGAATYMVSSAVAQQGIVYVPCQEDHTLAVRAGGRGDVTRSHVAWKAAKGATVPSPVCHEGYLYFASDRGVACCLNAKSGEVAYTAELKSPGGSMYPSAVLAGGNLYYLSQKGRVYVVAVSKRPAFELLAENDLADGSLFNASPAVAGNRLLLRSDRYLYCLGER